MVDRYTKIVLTVIAAALVTLTIQQGGRSASAVGESCGVTNPCYVMNVLREENGWVTCEKAGRPCFTVNTK